jgi:Na+/phosphate symporter
MTAKDFTFNPLKLFSPRHLRQEMEHEELYAKEVCEGIDLSEGLLITISKLIEMTQLLSKYVVSGAQAQCDKCAKLGLEVHTQEQVLTHCLLSSEVKGEVLKGVLRFPYRMERVGDMLESILACCREKAAKQIPFTDKAHGEMDQMFGVLIEMMNDLRDSFKTPNNAILEGMIAKGSRLNDMTEEFKLAHWERLEAGFCHIAASSMYRAILDAFKGAAEYLVKMAASLLALKEHAPTAD